METIDLTDQEQTFEDHNPDLKVYNHQENEHQHNEYESQSAGSD